MSSEPPIPVPNEHADAEAVERQYGKLSLVYAETRSKVAESIGRKDAAREWRQVEAEIECNSQERP